MVQYTHSTSARKARDAALKHQPFPQQGDHKEKENLAAAGIFNSNKIQLHGVGNKSKIILTKDWQVWFNKIQCIARHGIPLSLMS